MKVLVVILCLMGAAALGAAVGFYDDVWHLELEKDMPGGSLRAPLISLPILLFATAGFLHERIRRPESGILSRLRSSIEFIIGGSLAAVIGTFLLFAILIITIPIVSGLH